MSMGHVVLNTGACMGVEIPITEGAAEAVRFSFNPSGLDSVNRLKSLAAAFVAECQAQQAEKAEAGREFAVAITNMQTASMWAVLASTKGVSK
jgi:hypothetical protein